MNTWKAVLSVLAIFILGTVFGLIISFWITPDMRASAQPAQAPAQERLEQRLESNLSLSGEQKAAVTRIIDDTRKEVVQIRNETRPRVQQTLKTARDRIRAELNPEQRLRFDRMVQRNRRMLNRMFSR
jgi:hypothetical protein